MQEATFRCWKCLKAVTAYFNPGDWPMPHEWFAQCPECGAINYQTKLELAVKVMADLKGGCFAIR